MAVEYRLLGPLEALVDGVPAAIGGPRQRAVLAILAAASGETVPVSRLVDDVWPDEPPETAGNVLQNYVSRLRKALGREAIATRGRGYALVAGDDAVDLRRFERHAAAGARAQEAGLPDEAARELRAALALWRGPALADLADEPFARPIASRLDELRLAATERAIEAHLARGRPAEAIAELEPLVAEHPLREGLRALQMRALYADGRQADALAAYRDARSALVGELGIEPGPALQALEAGILRQDRDLAPASPRSGGDRRASRTVLAAALAREALAPIAAFGAPLAAASAGSLVVATTVTAAQDLAPASAAVDALLAAPALAGARARGAAFTSVTPGTDLARLAVEQEADLVVTDAPAGLLEDARLLTLIDEVPSDVAVLVGRSGPREGAVFVPFSGAGHDWSAIEVGAWLALALERPLCLAGASAGPSGRDASRLLASASLAIQRALGVGATPLIVAPEPQALVRASSDAGVVVVGLTERWRRDGLGRARTALAAAAGSGAPVLLVRRGLRPGGLAPGDSDTRFTWTIVPAGG